MEINRTAFEQGEANEWFRRNRAALEAEAIDKTSMLLADWLKPFHRELNCVLEIGCGSGHRLNYLSQKLKARGCGVEPSSDAVEYAHCNFPSLDARVGFGDDVPFKEKFDLVHLGFFLYLVDRELYLRTISEADRLVKFGGFLSIIDFETPFPYSNKYNHRNGVFTHKQNNCDVFVASGLYSVVNKYHFSHEDFCFNKNVNERVSLTLLYKETNIFEMT